MRGIATHCGTLVFLLGLSLECSLQSRTWGSSLSEMRRIAALCCASGSLAASDMRPPVSTTTKSRLPQNARV